MNNFLLHLKLSDLVNTIGYINDICSEHMRWEFQQQMKQSLENPKNDLGD